MWPRVRSLSPSLLCGILLLATVVVIAIVAPWVLQSRATGITDATNLSPSTTHPLGTDGFGRDLLSRSLVATRLTLLMAAAATALAVCGGVLIGTAIWLAPRRVREAGLRCLEIAVAYPGLLVALIIAAILGTGVTAVVLAIGLSNIPSFARMTANLAAGLSQQDFVTIARLLDVPRWRLALRHLVPNMAEPLLVLIASAFAVTIMEISGLSFIGLGVQAPDYDFGKLLRDALPAIYTRPSQVVGPTVMIILTALSAMLIGDGLAARAGRRSVPLRPGGPARIVDRPTSEEPAAALARGLRIFDGADHELVHGIDLELRRGEILGIVGESGSGKSLTAMALADLLPEGLQVRAEQLRVAEVDYHGTPDDDALARSVAMVYQDPSTSFNPARRLGGQLTEVLRRHRHMSRTEARDVTVESLDRLRVSDPRQRLHQYPHQLSGGMRQRCLIAMAWSGGAEVLIADEPTTALDVTVQAEILGDLRRLRDEQGTSMIFISHDIGVVEELCDRVLVMCDGRIVEELSAAALAAGDARDPYTQKLLAATPRLSERMRDV